jgi:DNA invertase Pin-like site-specific DNA recombinase
VPASATDFFLADTPTAVLVRQVLGAISQFEKTSLVAKLKAARDRKRAAGGRAEGRKSHQEKRPEVVVLAKHLYRRRLSLRGIAAELSRIGHTSKNGKPFSPQSVRNMLS